MANDLEIYFLKIDIALARAMQLIEQTLLATNAVHEGLNTLHFTEDYVEATELAKSLEDKIEHTLEDEANNRTGSYFVEEIEKCNSSTNIVDNQKKSDDIFEENLEFNQKLANGLSSSAVWETSTQNSYCPGKIGCSDSNSSFSKNSYCFDGQNSSYSSSSFEKTSYFPGFYNSSDTNSSLNLTLHRPGRPQFWDISSSSSQSSYNLVKHTSGLDLEREHSFNQTSCHLSRNDSSDSNSLFNQSSFTFGREYSLAKNNSLRSLKIVIHLKEHMPSEEILALYRHNFQPDALNNVSSTFSSYLQCKKITPTTAVSVLKSLLEIEEVALMLKYVKLSQSNTIVFHDNVGKYGYFELQNSSVELTELLLPQDEIILSNENVSIRKFKSEFEQMIFESNLYATAKLTEVSKDRVSFQFKNEHKKSINQLKKDIRARKKFYIAFRPQRWPHRYQYHALNLLEQNAALSENLFDISANAVSVAVCYDSINLNIMNPNISTNPQQLQAVLHILQSANPHIPYIVFGPPGTGKTATIVEAILQLRLKHPESHILVTTDSNSACDTIALLLCKYGKPNLLHDGQILRLYSKSITRDSFSNIEESLVDISNCGSGIHNYPPVEEIRKYGIVVATLCTVGKLVTAEIGIEHFSHVFIDEASTCTIPETLVGILGIKSSKCQVVLSGDHKQLGPVLESKSAAKLGLELSLMEYLLENHKAYTVDDLGEYNHSVQTRLIRNFRSHPAILKIFNYLYYDDKLVAPIKQDDNFFVDWPILKNASFPIIFQKVYGLTEVDRNTCSSSNLSEIHAILWYLQRLLNLGKANKWIDKSSIGIVAPYRKQCQLIEIMLKQNGWTGIEVGTAEKFQGREKDIIIASMVRSNTSLGFVHSPRRLNVILSRAKSLLIIIGNPKTLSRNKDFKYIIKQCKMNGSIRHQEQLQHHSKKDFKSNVGSKSLRNQRQTKNRQIKILHELQKDISKISII